MIRTTAYPRAALIGNPSDGYYGRTIAFVFRDFSAQVELLPSDHLHIVPCGRERLQFSSIHDLSQEIAANGYYGGVRLVKAAIRVFTHYAAEQGADTSANFRISYQSDIPGRLGLAGSSAIVTAAMRALMQFYKVEIPNPILANLILSAEKDELKIGAGLQDRVAQVYGTPVYMDFDKKLMGSRGYGEYVPFDKSLLPPIYLAYRTNLSEGSEMTHNDLARRYAAGDRAVLDAMEQWKALTSEFWRRVSAGDKNVADLINANYDLRAGLIPVSSGNKLLVETARSAGASAKFTGSGGAIIGTYTDDNMLTALREAMHGIGAEVLIPDIA
ncbi:MAG: GHMP kinase [Bacteroidetes bacterium]|nr:GHMP kinase [Bacteroidota bacterium]